jgi:hypothetical protein
MLISFYPPVAADNFPLRKPLVGSVFAAICLLGGLAAIFPRRCASIFHLQERNKPMLFHSVSSNSHAMKGHHSDCGRFSSHVIQADGYVLCAACTGLFIGALAAIVGTDAYFFVGLEIGQNGPYFMWIGVALLVLGFAQLRFRSYVRLMVNTVFVFGAFMVLAGADAFTESLFFDVYLICLIILWIFTRVLVSDWDHMRTCRSCGFKCK